MKARILVASALFALIPAAVTPLALAADPPAKPGANCPLYGSAGQTQMQRMQAMSAAMAAAKTPEERQKLMQEGLQTMQAGVAMMQGCPMGGGNNAAWREQMMERHLAMMQTMMPMMMQMMGGMMGMGMGPGGNMPGSAGMMGQGTMSGPGSMMNNGGNAPATK